VGLGMSLKTAAIKSLVFIIGHSQTFPRVLDEVNRVDINKPYMEGKDKREYVKTSLSIILDDLKPIAERVINLLIELALSYLEEKVKA
jgi:hypothetical protein